MNQQEAPRSRNHNILPNGHRGKKLSLDVHGKLEELVAACVLKLKTLTLLTAKNREIFKKIPSLLHVASVWIAM